MEDFLDPETVLQALRTYCHYIHMLSVVIIAHTCRTQINRQKFRCVGCLVSSFMYTHTLQDTAPTHADIRASIDRPISRESSASPDLVGDRSVHPVCDHKHSEQRHAAVV